MDPQRIAADLLRALRGRRSQAAFARRVGVVPQTVANWEHGRRWPTAARALAIAERTGVDLQRSLHEFHRREPRWLGEHSFASREGVASFLRDLRGKTRIVELARSSGKSRFAIARWLEGSSEPKLPDLLSLVEACSLRMMDFVAALVDPARLPSLKEAWRRLEQARMLAYDAPWTSAVLHALEMASYQGSPRHQPGFLAEQLGIPRREEERCLRLLEESGRIHWEGERWKPLQVGATDTRAHPQRARELRLWWAREGLARAERGTPGLRYTVCGVSSADLQRLQELQVAYMGEMRSVIAESQPVERVVLIVGGVWDLTEGVGAMG